ncbi:glutamate racemase [Aristophania vespae]|uniref:glutamate racemase n=1 Tax=Aristophania vespae TaxID=2697033 RepID=UPI002351A52C|nr:glutamate racemase [Aristophania vespae]UMM63305.1 Glutamate racemase [Aristophania vespae]
MKGSHTPPRVSPRILVFDSGIGGMGAVQALRHLAPILRIDYLADTALFPYGEQEDEFLTKRIVSLLSSAEKELKPDLLIVACNTASTLALTPLRQTLNLPIVGCVPPIRWAGRVSVSRTIGLLATSATIRRPYISQLWHDYADDCQLLVHGARNLADLAEQAFRGETPDSALVKHELDQLFNQKGGEKIDTIGLGCTHYSFLLPSFQRVAPAHIAWLDPAPAVAQQALRRLKENWSFPLYANKEATAPRFFMTSLPADKDRLTEQVRWLGYNSCELFPTP